VAASSLYRLRDEWVRNESIRGAPGRSRHVRQVGPKNLPVLGAGVDQLKQLASGTCRLGACCQGYASGWWCGIGTIAGRPRWPAVLVMVLADPVSFPTAGSEGDRRAVWVVPIAFRVIFHLPG